MPVALTKPAVNKLPPVILPLALTTPVIYSPVVANVAIAAVPVTPMVTLLFAAITTLLLPLTIELPALTEIPVNADPLPMKKLPVTLPVADINPTVVILPCIALPVLLINPTVNMLPPVILAALVMVLVADINPAVNMLPPLALPVTVKLVNVPTLVIFG